MSRYVDGFVVPVPRDKVDEYLEVARLAGEVWKEYGALAYVECLADDVEAGEVTSFPRSVQCTEDETVVFAFIIYESREQRDEVNKKAMNDPRFEGFGPETMPFDAKRMFWGGFKTIVDL